MSSGSQVLNTTKEYTAHIDIYGLNRTGLLNDVLQVLSNTTKNISTVNAQPTKDMKFANIHVSLFGIANLSMLTTVVDKIKSVPEVLADQWISMRTKLLCRIEDIQMERE